MTEVSIQLPYWLGPFSDGMDRLGSDDERMRFVVELSRRNVTADTGGPFAAAVISETTGAIIAAGVNVVMPSSAAIAHGEVMAVALAGQQLKSFDVGVNGPAGLYTSCEPCLMCLGATMWSGVTRLVIGARDEDATAVGFDEGPKPHDWIDQFEARGISVVRDVIRAEAARVLDDYLELNGNIYNASRDTKDRTENNHDA